MKLLIYAIVFSIGHLCFTQNKSLKVEYDFYLNFSKSQHYDATLYIDNGKLLFKSKIAKLIANSKGDSSYDFTITLFKADTIGNYNYTDLKKDSIYSRLRWFAGKIYRVNERRTNIQWEISNETQIIGTFNCQKAIGFFRGRTYIAWFTTKFPVSAAPWKLQGLPGLVLKVSDTEGKIQFIFKSIKVIKKTAVPKLPNENFENISIEQYAKILSSFQDELSKKMMSKMSRGTKIEIKNNKGTMEIFK
jgi:GLPGLI family protein